ncbi:MAG: Globin domain-containing protein [Cocleimonas sp.]|nr:Globin domain-containing protein [Cocleimonas sp.]
MNLSDTTTQIFKLIPEAILPNAKDEEVIMKHNALLISYENDLVTGFLDIAYNTSNLSDRLSSEDRKTREQTLRQWYRLTMAGSFDEHYWNWQVLAGIEHVQGDIPNAVMLTMRGWVMSFFQQKLLHDLEQEEAIKVLNVLQKVQSVGSSLTVASFVMTRKEALRLASGLNDAILSRLISIEINKLLKDGKLQLAISTEPQKIAA